MKSSTLLLGLLVTATLAAAAIPKPRNLSSYYTAYPAPIGIFQYLDAIFKCQGDYALCAYATCVPIPNSNPPVAECGCYAFNGVNIGFGPGILNKQIKATTTKQCSRNGKCLTTFYNRASFCHRMNRNTMYPGYKYVSTWNPTAWAAATNQTGDVPEGYYSPKICQGGTFTNCFAAACRAGKPSSQYLPPGQPAYNATCYCPYTTTKRKFGMSSQEYPCGPTDPSKVTRKTLIYNGA